MEEANKLIGTGKKHLVMGKVVEAVGALQEACGMLAKKYGDTADECGEAFFWYGKALLDLARMENSVLGNALEGVPEADEEDEEKPKDPNIESTENIDEKTRDELRVQVYDAMAEKKDEAAEKKDEGKESEDAEKNGDAEKVVADEHQETAKEEGDENKTEVEGSKSEDMKENKDPENEEESADKPEGEEDGEEQEGEEEDNGEEEMEGDAEEQGEGDGTAEKDSDDEEVGNLQLAWEMLEVAKVIYKRKETKEDQLMAAQAHLKLGEVSAESGNYSQALEDFQECLKLQVKHLDSDSRLLAETHYQLGLTYSLNLQYSKAIEELNSSISVIKRRLDKLQELLDKADGPEVLPNERKEMEELKALLPEIQEKVEDATEGLKIASTAAEAVKDVLDGGSTSSAFPGSTAHNSDGSSTSKTDGTSTNDISSTNGHPSPRVSDISHLVRKKRKPEESPVKQGQVKKVKQDDSQADEVQKLQTDGVHKATGDANGHTTSMEVESQ
ncbi:histone-binding protein N1/N2-like isoform X2 [Mastacembelus armatus]|uniref:Nuclear autoantigenic sperm protein n=1 Tax=Mastacembelus armatus TaxID=205130 RepID=A0A3Q3RHB1_9TELE|nr:histone-binding protein N1/N2-like isoform X2 [Mastacembelus armatus]